MNSHPEHADLPSDYVIEHLKIYVLFIYVWQISVDFHQLSYDTLCASIFTHYLVSLNIAWVIHWEIRKFFNYWSLSLIKENSWLLSSRLSTSIRVLNEVRNNIMCSQCFFQNLFLMMCISFLRFFSEKSFLWSVTNFWVLILFWTTFEFLICFFNTNFRFKKSTLFKQFSNLRLLSGVFLFWRQVWGQQRRRKSLQPVS